MKKTVFFTCLTLFVSCKSYFSFQDFFDKHKTEVGASSFQVPNFLKSVINTLPGVQNSAIGKIDDFKYLTLQNINETQKNALIQDINLVTTNQYNDIIRVNTAEETKIISVIETFDTVSDFIYFKSTPQKTSAFYFSGDLNLEKIQAMTQDGATFDNFSNNLIQSLNSKNSYTPRGIIN